MGAILKTIPIMDHEKNEERYRYSQDDITVIRKEVNKLTQVVGDLTDAIRGNDLGNKGFVVRLEAVEKMAETLTKKINDIVANAKSRDTYVKIIWGLICFVIGTIFMVIVNKLVPSVIPKK